MRRLTVLAASLVLVACDTPADDMASLATVTAGTTYALPPSAPSRFSFGSDASETRVALWDIDVKPDGEGLPAGSGTVVEGEAGYMVHCISCHGPTGVEGPYDVLVGTEPWGEWPGTRTVGSYWPVATTLWDYVNRAMPFNQPGSLGVDEVYAAVAYVLFLNDLVGERDSVDANTLPRIAMPNRDGFVTDPRPDIAAR